MTMLFRTALLMLALAVPEVGATTATGAEPWIHPDSVKRTHQGIEARVTWAHDPISSTSAPSRSFNESTVQLVVRCRDMHLAWREWEQVATYSGREVISTTFAGTFTPASDAPAIEPIANRLCTDATYRSLPVTTRPVDGNLPALTLVCRTGAREPKTSRTLIVNFAEGTVNDSLAEISSSKIIVRYATDDGVRVDEVDRYSGAMVVSLEPAGGGDRLSISGECEKVTQRAF